MLSTAPSFTVAVTGPDKRFPLGWWATRFMLSLCGLRTIYLTPKSPTLAENIHGIVVGGGDDIEPEHYGAIKTPSRNYDPARDQLEMTMIRQAQRASIPILGICRGAQLINVVNQGTLLDDIRPLRRHTPNSLHIRRIKWVDLIPDCQLQRYLAVDKIKVNSLHNQAIDSLGNGLTTIGVDRDGFVQAIEGHDNFLLGVQWHPEYLPYSYLHRQLFALFADAVKQTKAYLSPS